MRERKKEGEDIMQSCREVGGLTCFAWNSKEGEDGELVEIKEIECRFI